LCRLENLQEEFRMRFQEFSSVGPVTKFVVNPFNAVDASETATLIGNVFQADVGEPVLETITIQVDLFQFHRLSCNVFSKLKFVKPKVP
jgi:hypothetical protein